MFNAFTDYNIYAMVTCWLCLCYLYYLSNDTQRDILFVASLACVILVPVIVILLSPKPDIPSGIAKFFGMEPETQYELHYFMGVIAFMVLTAIPMYFYRNKELPSNT